MAAAPPARTPFFRRSMTVGLSRAARSMATIIAMTSRETCPKPFHTTQPAPAITMRRQDHAPATSMAKGTR